LTRRTKAGTAARTNCSAATAAAPVRARAFICLLTFCAYDALYLYPLPSSLSSSLSLPSTPPLLPPSPSPSLWLDCVVFLPARVRREPPIARATSLIKAATHSIRPDASAHCSPRHPTLYARVHTDALMLAHSFLRLILFVRACVRTLTRVRACLLCRAARALRAGAQPPPRTGGNSRLCPLKLAHG
jgi:hypothetical protein